MVDRVPARRHSLRILVAAALLLGLALLAVGTFHYWANPALEPPLLTDLDRLEPALAEQIRVQVRAVRDDPDDAENHGQLGILYQAHGYPDLAKRCYENALHADGSQPRWRYHWAALVTAQGDTAGAESALREVIATAPNYAPAHERLALVLLDRNAHREAADWFHHVIRLRPQAPQGYIGLGKVDLALGRPESAANWLLKGVAVGPANTEAHYLLGRAYRRLGRREEAEVEFARGRGRKTELLTDPWLSAIAQARVTHTARFELATDLLERGRTDEAAQLFETLLELEPDSANVMNNLSVAYLRLGRLDDAEHILNQALQVEGGHYAIHDSLARVLLAKGESHAALAHAEEATRLAPTIGRAAFTKGFTLTRLGRYEEALQTFQQVARLDARNPNVHVNIGQLLGHFERWDDAVEAFKHAVAYRPQCVETRYDLGMAYSRAGRFEESFDTFQNTLELDPDNERVKDMLEWTRARLRSASR